MKNTSATTNKTVTLSLNQYVKAGYVFSSWNTKRDGSGKKISDGATVYVNDLVDPYDTSGVIHLYAQWEKEVIVTVTFDLNGGIDPNDTKTKKVVVTKPYGDLPTGLTPPAGMIFDGWEDDEKRPITKSTPVTKRYDHTLHAKWRPDEYVIHFDGNGNLIGTMADITCKYGEQIKLPNCAFDLGKYFDCWGTKPDGTGKNYAAGSYESLVGGDYKKREITLYALWKEKKYTVEYYDSFSGKLIYKAEAEEVIHKYYPKSDSEYEGLKLYGWSKRLAEYEDPFVENYKESDIVLKAGQPTIVTENLKVYSVYEPINKDDKIPIVFNLRGGTNGPATMYVDRPDGRATYPFPTVTPTKGRSTFDGWAIDPSGNYGVTEIEVLEWDNYVILYARWAEGWATVRIDYGFDGLKSTVYLEPDELEYKFGKPKDRYDRPGYNISGWKTKDGKIYKVGESVPVSNDGLEITALWEPKQYSVKYYDQITGKFIKEETISYEENITTETYPIIGMDFSGWFYTLDSNQVVFKPGTPISEIVDLFGTGTSISLKSYYTSDSSYVGGKLNVYYNLNAKNATGGPQKATIGDSGTGIVVTSSEKPSRDGCYFRGWSRFPDGEPECKAGGEIDCYNRMYPDYVILYAIWGSNFKFTLQCNGVTNSKYTSFDVPNALPGENVNISQYKHIFGSPSGYTFLGWGLTKDKVSYAFDQEIPVPYKHATLYAIWRKDTYIVRFCDGFSGDEIDRMEVEGKGTITIPKVSTDVPGYRFTGWTTEPYYYNSEPEYGLDVKTLYVDKDIRLYATYEKLPAAADFFTIVYLPNGGTGGPGTVQYTPGTVTLSSAQPTRDGYTFLGWTYSNQHMVYVGTPAFPEYKINTVTGAKGEKLELYAVWRVNADNDVKLMMEDRYGKKAINDEFFDKPYESSDWEKASDTAYYVVRTKDKHNSYLLNDLVSTLMLMEYKNGSWNLEAYGAKEGVWEELRLDILTSHTNTMAGILDISFSIASTAKTIGIGFVSVFIPEVGIVVDSMHYLNKVADAWKTKKDDQVMGMWLLETIYGVGTDILLEEALGKLDGEMIKYCLDQAYKSELTKAVENGWIELFKLAEQSLREELKSSNGHMDPFGNYDKAIKLFKDRVAGQKFSQTVVNLIPHYVDEIYKYVNYNK